MQTGASTAEGDGGSSIALDSSGNVYVTGSAASLDFPVTSSAFQRTNKASSVALFNAFVTKLNSTGSALVYSTYLGGSGGAAASAGDYATGIALDGAGEAFVAGQTASSDFPITKSSFQKVNHAAMNGSSNAFITKLNADGSSLIYSTYLGGSGKYGDYAATIAVDHDGNAYAAGGTYSSDFPVTSGAFQQTTHAAAQGYENGFVAKLNPEGTRLVYSTYLGGTTSSAEVNGIAVDASGRAYLTGLTDPRAAEFNDFPVTADAYEQEDQVSYPAFQAFLTEINTDGSSLDYSTVLGSITEGVGIALDKGRSAYVTGSTCFGVPTTSHAYKPEGPANVECTAFVSKFGAADTRAILPSVTKIIPYGKNPQFAGVDLFYGVTVLPGPGSSLLTGSVNILVDGSLLDTLSVNNLTGPPSFEAHGLTEGKHLIEAEYSGDEHYSPSDAKFEQTLAGAVSRISIVSGDRQEGIIGSAFAEPLVVLVRDNAGKPAPGVPVYYYSPSVGLSAQNVTTDSYGEASVTAIPEASGKLTVGVSINGGSYPSVVFYLTAVKP